GTDLEVIGGARTGKSSGRGTSGGAAAGTNRPPGTGKPADQGGGPGTSGPGTVPPVTPPPGTGPGTDGDLGPAEPPGPGPHGYVLTTVRADAIVTTSADVSWELDDPAGRVRQVSVSWSTGG